MTHPRLTDEAVGRLPLSRARAELLEDIMATAPVESVTDAPVRRPRRRGTLIAVGTAAATVAALFAVPALLSSADTPARQQSAPADGRSSAPADGRPSAVTKAAAPPAAPPAAVTGDRLVLTAPGWTMEYTYEGDGSLEAQYVNGEQRFDLMRGPADQYASYYEDRSHITPLDSDVTRTPKSGEPVTLLGKPAEMWAYSANDHTTIGVVQHGWYPEVRGFGMDEAAYLELLGQVRAVSDAEYEAALPESFVTDAERRSVINEMTADMTLPPGFGVSSDQSDRYQLGAEVSGAVACAWLDRWSKGRETGDEQLTATAAAALAGARDWAVLKEMEPVGDYPEVLWEIVDDVEKGKPTDWYKGGLGCP